METITLSNQTEVTLINQPNTEAVTILAILPVGSRDESEGLYGVSHFIEHMIFKGTEKRPSSLDISKEIDKLGADYNAFTSKEYTGFYIKVAKEHFEHAIEILSDVIYNSTFDPKQIEKEKSVIMEEISMYEDNPMMDIRNVFAEVLYKNSPLEHDIAGTRDTVLNLERSEILEYKQQHYQPSNLQLITTGDIPKDSQQIIDEYFGSVETEDNNYSRESAEFGPTDNNKRFRQKEKDTDQLQLMLGFPAYNFNSAKLPALEILNVILGSNMSSRLFVNVREKLGLAYSIRSGIAKYTDIGHLYVKAGLDTENITEAIKEIKNVLGNLSNSGVEQKEYEDAKTNIEGKMKLRMEDSKSKALWFGRRAVCKDELEAPEAHLKKIKKTTKAEVEAVAEEIFDFNLMRIAIIGDVEEDFGQFL